MKKRSSMKLPLYVTRISPETRKFPTYFKDVEDYTAQYYRINSLHFVGG